jgi:hypothetical protein
MAKFTLNIDEDITSTSTGRFGFYAAMIKKYNWKYCALNYDEIKISKVANDENLSGIYCPENDVVYCTKNVNANTTFLVQILTTKQTSEQLPQPQQNPWFILQTNFNSDLYINVCTAIDTLKFIGLEVKVVVSDYSSKNVDISRKLEQSVVYKNILYFFDPIHILVNLRKMFLKNLIMVRFTRLSHVTVINDKLGYNDSKYWLNDFLKHKGSSGEPSTKTLLPLNYIQNLINLKNDNYNEFLRDNGINVEEINCMIELVEKIELTFQRMYESKLYDIMSAQRDKEFNDYFRNVRICNTSLTVTIPTELVLKRTLFQTPIALFKNGEGPSFALLDLNQWTLESVFTKIINFHSYMLQPTKKEFMIKLNHINKMDKTIIDESSIRFHRTLKNYLGVPDTVGKYVLDNAPLAVNWVTSTNHRLELSISKAMFQISQYYISSEPDCPSLLYFYVEA